MLYTRYGPFDNKELTYIDCTEYPYEERENDEYPVESCMQTLECTCIENDDGQNEEENIGENSDGWVVYQTVTCME